MSRKVGVWDGYQPVKWAFDFHKSRVRFRGVKGGYRSGKSFAMCKEVIRHATMVGGQRWLIGRQDFTDLRETVLKTFLAALGPCMGIMVGKYHETHHTLKLRCADGGISEILFKSVEDVQSLGSLELTGFYVCEAGEMSEQAFDMLGTRLNYGPGPHMGILDWNPTSKAHWLYRRFVEKKNSDLALFTASTYDNRVNLPDGYIESLEMQHDSEWVTRFLEGEWGFTGEGSPVFPMFRASRHVAKYEVLADVPLVIGWDFGFRRPAAVIGQIQGPTLWVLDGLLGEDDSLDIFADRVEELTDRYRPGGNETNRHYGDIAGAQANQITGSSCLGFLASRGIHVATKKQGIQDGLMVVRSKLEKIQKDHFGLMVAEGCNELFIEALKGGYHYPDSSKETVSRDKNGDPLPVKDGIYDHMMDAFRYMMVGIYGIAGTNGRSRASQALNAFGYGNSPAPTPRIRSAGDLMGQFASAHDVLRVLG